MAKSELSRRDILMGARYLAATPLIGTLSPMPGIENVCPTLQPDHVLMAETGLPLTSSVLPIVPVTRPQYGFRSGVQPS